MKDKNIEQQLADKLGNRSVTPSDQAWQRIAHNRQRGKQQKKSFALYYATAAAIILLIGSYMFFGINKETALPVKTPTVVNSEKQEKLLSEPEIVAQPDFSTNQNEVVIVKENQISVEKKSAERQMPTVFSKPEIQPEIQQTQELYSTVVEEKPVFSKDDEVEILLKNATKEVAAKKQFSQSTSDTALLKEVESEMNEYYRDKAMKIFNLKHKTIRFAIKDKE